MEEESGVAGERLTLREATNLGIGERCGRARPNLGFGICAFVKLGKKLTQLCCLSEWAEGRQSIYC